MNGVYLVCPYCGRVFDARIFFAPGSGRLMRWLFKRHYSRERRKAERAE